MSTSHKFANNLDLNHLNQSEIVETGSSRTNYFEDSSTFFEKISNEYNTDFFTIDFSEEVINSIPLKFTQKNFHMSGEDFIENILTYFSKKTVYFI